MKKVLYVTQKLITLIGSHSHLLTLQVTLLGYFFCFMKMCKLI